MNEDKKELISNPEEIMENLLRMLKKDSERKLLTPQDAVMIKSAMHKLMVYVDDELKVRDFPVIFHLWEFTTLLLSRINRDNPCLQVKRHMNQYDIFLEDE